MSKIARALAMVTAAALLLGAPAGAEPKFKRLGEDPALDAPPALDVTYLDVARNGSDLVIRIGVNGMLPGPGGYPELPGIEWYFTTGKRKFLAEAYVSGTSGAFLLFEDKDGAFEVIGDLEGTYDWNDGYISMLVPLHHIGARRGTKVKGAAENDVDSHIHAVVTTEYPDYLTTTKAYKIP
jgi:hypothetical protein